MLLAHQFSTAEIIMEEIGTNLPFLRQ